MNERLQKILARAGYGSRRAAEGMITAGRVRVNGAVVTELGTQADATTDSIEVDGKAITVTTERVYLAMNKPSGIVTTARDPQRRRTVMELLPADLPPGVVPVGRLDRDTKGLLIFTNDGELAHRLAHPRYGVEKEYLALVAGRPGAEVLRRLRTGIEIEGRMTAPASVAQAGPPSSRTTPEGQTWLRLVIHEGRKRQVRLMCAAVGHPVRELVRTRVGDVELGGLPPGETRPLTGQELASLRRSLRLDRA
jgi:pseudouridine synthase